MAFTLEDLDVVLEHEEYLGRISAVRVPSNAVDVVEIDIALRRPWHRLPAPDDETTVVLRFHGVVTWQLSSGFIAGVRIEDDHPALVPLESSMSRLSYRGEPSDPKAVYGALLAAHRRAVGRVAPHYMQPGASFLPGWTTGTVANGPSSLMTAYADVLRAHGLDAILTPSPNRRPEQDRTPLVVCAIDDGYVVCTSVATDGDLPPSSLLEPNDHPR